MALRAVGLHLDNRTIHLALARYGEAWRSDR